MEHFHYTRHFAVLGVATLLAFLLAHWDLLNDSLIMSFAINGALHAIALALTLRVPRAPQRKLAFIMLASALSVLTMYIGITGLVIFAVLPGNERLYAVLGLCAVSGAITYGSIIRLFWLGKFPSKLILGMAIVCLLATWLAFFIRLHADFLGGWWLAAAWWFAFSGGLWFFDTHPHALDRPKYNRP
jgi:hypothetical protein